MKVPKFPRLMVEDYPSQSSWIGDLLNILNQSFEQLNQALNRNLTITDNMDAEIKELALTGSDAVSFTVTTRNRPKGVLVSNIVTVSGSAPTSAVQPVWSYNSTTKTITISSWFGGLSASAKYQVTLFIHTS